MCADISNCIDCWPRKAGVLPVSGGLPDKDNDRFVASALRGSSYLTL